MKLPLRADVARLVLSVPFVFLFSDAALACARAFPDYKVISNFNIRVTLDSTPLPDSQVLIEKLNTSGPDEIVASGTTDDSGEIGFTDLSPGKYFISVKHAGLDSDGDGYLTVVSGASDPSVQSLLVVSWPSANFTPVQETRGHLSAYEILPVGGSDRNRRRALVGASISFTEFVSSQKVSEAVTGADGSFDVWDLQPGVYVAFIKENPKSGKENWRIDGHILVQVRPSAKRQDLSALLVMTDCGLSAEFEPTKGRNAQTH